MHITQWALFGCLASMVAGTIWAMYARGVAGAPVPVVLVQGTDGRTREVPLDELERRLGPRS
jgi:hypothetical protein